MSDFSKIIDKANESRMRVLEMCIDRNGAYLGQTCSSAEILSTLYNHCLKLKPVEVNLTPGEFEGVPSALNTEYITGAAYNGPREPGLDRLLIFPAHYATGVYSALISAGRLSENALMKQFNIDGYKLEMIGAEHSPGFELTTGSFGQAISQAAGIALAKRRRQETGRVFVFMSDGELEEGQTWEGFQFLAHYKLDNVIVVVDVNGMQYDGYTKDVMNIEPINSRLMAFGADVVTVDGHNPIEIANAIDGHVPDGRPFVVLCYTNPAQGIALLEKRKPKLHFVKFNAEELKEIRDLYNIA